MTALEKEMEYSVKIIDFSKVLREITNKLDCSEENCKDLEKVKLMNKVVDLYQQHFAIPFKN